MSQSKPTPVILSAAVTGGLEAPEAHPHFPRDPEAIGRDAVEAAEAGASIVHIHARDDEGAPRWEAEYFDRSVRVVRDSDIDVVINLTTSWGGRDPECPWERRFAPLSLAPELASYDCGTINFRDDVFYNSVSFLRQLAKEMLQAGVKPEIEIFDAGMIRTAIRLAEEGLLEPPLYFQFVLGMDAGAPATVKELMHMVELIPEGSLWSVCAVGRKQLPMNAAALAAGGNVRTGLEDNLMFRRREPATNRGLVERLRWIIEAMNLEVATAAQAREMLALSGR